MKPYISDQNTLRVFKRLRDLGKPLVEFCFLKNGVNTGNAAKILLSRERMNEKYRKILEGKDINRYSIQWKGLWINYDTTLKSRIDFSKLETRQKRIDFSLRDEKTFNSVKIIIRQTSDRLIAAYDDRSFITRHSTHLILVRNENTYLRRISKKSNMSSRYTISSSILAIKALYNVCQTNRADFLLTRHLKYILALLNSKLLNFYYRLLVPEKGRVFAEVKIVNLGKLPIRESSIHAQTALIDLVDQIHVLTHS